MMFNSHGNVAAASVHVAAIAMKSLAKVRAFLTRTDFGWDQTVSICFNSCFEERCDLMGHGSPRFVRDVKASICKVYRTVAIKSCSNKYAFSKQIE